MLHYRDCRNVKFLMVYVACNDKGVSNMARLKRMSDYKGCQIMEVPLRYASSPTPPPCMLVGSITGKLREC